YDGCKKQVYVRDLDTGTTSLVSRTAGGQPGNGDSAGVQVSGDGRYVAFASLSDDLVPDDTNQRSDVFVFDRVDGSIERVSVSNSGLESLNGGSDAPAISED